MGERGGLQNGHRKKPRPDSHLTVNAATDGEFFQNSGATSEIFSATGPFLKGARFFTKKLTVLLLYEISKSLIRDPSFRKTDYKVLLHPEEGKKAIDLEGTYLEDTLALKLIGDGATRVAFYRRKDPFSKADKLIHISGGSRILSIEEKSVDISKMLSDISRHKDDMRLEPESRETLKRLFNHLVAIRRERDSLFNGALMKLPKTARVAERLAQIGKLVSDLDALERDFYSERSRALSGLSVESVASAIVKCPWPISAQDSAEFASLFQGKSQARLLAWCKDYLTEAMPRAFGVELLERSTVDSVSELRSIFEISKERIAKEKPGNLPEFFRLAGRFDTAFNAILQIVIEADHDFKAYKSAQEEAPSWWLQQIAKQNDRRAKVLRLLSDLALGNVAYLDGGATVRINVILSSMAANLCAIGKAESDAWEKLLPESKSGLSMKKTPKSEDFLKRIRKFHGKHMKKKESVSAHKEAESLARIAGLLESGADEYKIAMKAIETRLFSQIRELARISPEIGGWVDEIYVSKKGHLSYKQGEKMAGNIMDAYFLGVLSLMAFKSSLPPEEHAARLSIMIDSNAEIFDSLPKSIQGEIGEDISKMLFTETRAFDLAPDTGALRARAFRGEDLHVHYRFSTEINEEGREENILNARFHNSAIQVKVDGALPYDEGYIPAFLEPVHSKSASERIYGKELQLEQIVGKGESKSIGCTYRRLYEVAYSDPGLYARVEERLRTMDTRTAHALSTLIDKGFQTGCVTSNLGKNMPEILNQDLNRNTLLDRLLEKYPDFDVAHDEVEAFQKMRAARRIFMRLTSDLPYYIGEHAKSIVSGTSAQTEIRF